MARIHQDASAPVVAEIVHGGYTEMVPTSKADEDVPGRWVDWLDYHPETRWISTAWRQDADHRSYGAYAALQALVSESRYSEPYPRRIQITPKVWKGGGIICAVCGGPFTAVNAADLPEEDDG
ncbi:hypothetical protein [Streptomyces sp. NPDC051162]|uniref:hypothetical protein n=1 Tax=Streptomyces sp. NPDC051162 TaxID=3154747 RepID=UPI003420FD72